MRFRDFESHIAGWWNAYLGTAHRLKRDGGLRSPPGTNVYFPSLLLVTKTPRHYVAELAGARPGFQGLSVKRQRAASVDEYLGQFQSDDHEALFELNGARHGFLSLTLAQDVTVDEVEERFPFVGMYPSVLHRIGGRGSPILFGPKFRSCMFDNCMILNQLGGIFRVKHLLNCVVVSHGVIRSSLDEWLQESARDQRILGVHTCGAGREEALVKAAQFASLYLSASSRETTIGEFLRDHPDVVEGATDAPRFIYEPYLRWVDGPSDNEDEAINPDLLVQRPSGDWDIYDLKTAVLTRKSITKGRRRRRRFIDYVEEGIAQLAHYREYFSFEANRAHALERYGADVRAPRLVLVVGNLDNAREGEIREASRRLGEISLIDFDTFSQLFLIAASGLGGDADADRTAPN